MMVCFLVGEPVMLDVRDNSDGPAYRNLDETLQMQTMFSNTILIACSM